MTSPDVEVDPSSLKNSARELTALARDVQTGQFDLFLLDWAGAPRSHADVAAAMRTFAEFAHDQYRDVVALLAALATRVDAAAGGYQQTDEAVAQMMTTFLSTSTYQSAGQRPK